MAESSRGAAPCEDYLAYFTNSVSETLGGGLVGLYLQGSAVQQDFDPATSDIDILGVVSRKLRETESAVLASLLAHDTRPVPATGLDFILCHDEAAKAPVSAFPFEFAFSTGPECPTELEPPGIAGEIPVHIALCRASGLVLYGPPPTEAFAPISRELLYAGLIEEMEWHLRELAGEAGAVGAQNAVLNAARSLYAAETGMVLSKSQGARWWLEREPDDRLVAAALKGRGEGKRAELDRDQVIDFVKRVIDQIDALTG